MDIEIVARAFRYFRFESERFVDHNGMPMLGLSVDPRDFFSLVVFTVCRTNIRCCCQAMPDLTDVVHTRPLERDGLGVFIRHGEGDVETTLRRFNSSEACTFAEDAAAWLEQNTRPGAF
jgi:hypothetical protein